MGLLDNATKRSELAEEVLREETGRVRNQKKIDRATIATVSISWALFQLSLPRLIILDSITIRAIHLAFAAVLVFLSFPLFKRMKEIKFLNSKTYIPLIDYVLAIIGCIIVLYIVLDWQGISMRAGIPNTRDIIIGILLVFIVFEASRRVIGLPLVIIAILFSVYSFIAPYMPAVFALRGVTLAKYIGQVALSFGRRP